MNTKEIVKTIENLTGLCFEISINDNQTEVTSTFNPEKINYEYFNVCNELESYFTELYLDSNNLILERILYLLNDGLKLWNRLKKESFNINLNFENKELKNLETELTDAELLRVAEIKIYYIQNLISKIENLTGSPKAKALPPQPIIKQKPELKLKDFFIKEVPSDTIEAIQTEFRELEGKDLAILIYLLNKEHKIIEILTNSKTKGRSSFVKSLKENDKPSMQKVNKCFVANTDDLIYSKDDLVFQSLNKRLTEIIKK